MDSTSICHQITHDADLILKILGLLGGIIVFTIGSSQYKTAQRWKKSEFLAKEMNDFNNNEDVMRAMVMLDWTQAEIFLYEEERLNELKEKTELSFDNKLLEFAFSDHIQIKDFKDEGFVIRQIFDTFFYELGKFQIYLDNNLIAKQDLEKHVYYWLRILAGQDNKGKSSLVIKSLWNYIDVYQYDNIKKLLNTYGFIIDYNSK